jgi:hypothetical protein
MTYTWAGNAASGNAYRVRPVNALGGGVPDFQPTNPRPAAPDAVGGTLRVGVLNLLNYFDTFAAAPPASAARHRLPRRREPIEFERQVAKTVAAILGMDVDVLGVIEIENDGYGPDSAIQDLVDRLNDATRPAPGPSSTPTPAPARSTRSARRHQGGPPLPPGGRHAGRHDRRPEQRRVRQRRRRRFAPQPAGARAGVRENATGEVFVAVVNHLKSKGSAPATRPTPATARATATRSARAPPGAGSTGWPPTPPAPATPTCSSSATSTPTPRRTRSRARGGRATSTCRPRSAGRGTPTCSTASGARSTTPWRPRRSTAR